MISVTFGRVVSIALIGFLLACTIGVSFQTTVDSEPESKCVNIKLDDSQRVYLSGSGEKGSVGPIGPPGKVGPRGETGISGPKGSKGEKGSKGDSNVLAIKMLQTRLTSAERIISNLLMQTARPAAHLYGSDIGQHSYGHVFQWLSGRSGEFVDNGMNYTNGYLTVPKPGLYYIYVQVNCDPDQNSWCGYSIRVNGNTVINNYVEHSSSAINIIHGQTSESGLLRKLNAGDRLSVTTRHIDYFGSGETSYHIGSQSFFGAVWLSSVSL
jgi:hypothetical protein